MTLSDSCLFPRYLPACKMWIRLAYENKGFPGGTSGKESACQCRRHKRCGFSRWVRKIPWRRKWQPTPVFLPGDVMDRGDWWAIVHGVTESQIQLSKHIQRQTVTGIAKEDFKVSNTSYIFTLPSLILCFSSCGSCLMATRW